MAKRTTFYVTTALFEMDISFKAKLVLTYLSRTSNKEGTCYPSIASIARCCGCCKNTVRKALRELESAGIVSVTPSYAERTVSGGARRTSIRSASPVHRMHRPRCNPCWRVVQQMERK